MKSVSDLIYDSDVTPEKSFNYADSNISYHVGHFILDEQLGDDATGSAQVTLHLSGLPYYEYQYLYIDEYTKKCVSKKITTRRNLN